MKANHSTILPIKLVAALFFCVFSLPIIAAEKIIVPEKPDFTPDPEMATVYIYRPPVMIGVLLKFQTYFNDRFLGSYLSQRFMKVTTKPGTHDIWAHMDDGPVNNLNRRAMLELFVQKNKIYFVEEDIESGVGGELKLKLVNNDIGEKAVNEIFTGWMRDIEFMKDDGKSEF